MYLVSLLFQGITAILLLIFIIATMIGIYLKLNFSSKTSEDSSKFTDKADERVNVDIINGKYDEDDQKLSVETEFMDINYTETTIHIEDLTEANSTNAESTIEDEVHSSDEGELNRDIKEEISTSKSSNKRYKKKR